MAKAIRNLSVFNFNKINLVFLILNIFSQKFHSALGKISDVNFMYNLFGLKNYYGLKIQIQNFVLVFLGDSWLTHALSCVVRFMKVIIRIMIMTMVVDIMVPSLCVIRHKKKIESSPSMIFPQGMVTTKVLPSAHTILTQSLTYNNNNSMSIRDLTHGEQSPPMLLQFHYHNSWYNG
jgi:hypothetical protein